jgi:hypothetical protein
MCGGIPEAGKIIRIFVGEYLREIKQNWNACGAIPVAKSKLEYLWWDTWDRLQIFRTRLVFSRL